MDMSVIFLTIAILGGAMMAATRLKGHAVPPLALAILHGAVAGAGLVAVGLAVRSDAVPAVTVAALAGLIVAALGGAVAFFHFHLKKKVLPLPLLFVHASVAVVSFLMLVMSVMGVAG